MNQSTKFSFGSTSAIITNIALIIGLDSATNAKVAIIGSLLVMALADNISDTLGIHMYQESEGLNKHRVWLLTITNFLSRFITSMGFVAIIAIFPLQIAVPLSLIYGLAVLTSVSYMITKGKHISPWPSICEHLVIAVIVITLSRFAGRYILNKFQ
jgi:vacuolar iron transporter family protein